MMENILQSNLKKILKNSCPSSNDKQLLLPIAKRRRIDVAMLHINKGKTKYMIAISAPKPKKQQYQMALLKWEQ